MNDDTHDLLAKMTLATGRMDMLVSTMQEQTRNAQSAMRAFREQEEANFKHAMLVQFQDQQQRMEGALRPTVAWAWKVIAVSAGFSALLLLGYWLLLRQADTRLRAAQERADAVEVRAEILDAASQVELTSCGGRPCIRIDHHAPTWKSNGAEYILVDSSASPQAKRP